MADDVNIFEVLSEFSKLGRPIVLRIASQDGTLFIRAYDSVVVDCGPAPVTLESGDIVLSDTDRVMHIEIGEQIADNQFKESMLNGISKAAKMAGRFF